jgi:hypothetical protein
MDENQLLKISSDNILIRIITNQLPALCLLAKQESAMAGKIGMKVSSVRENLIIVLLI